ncbi:ABC-type glycerol-3-phosphate transport system substrate-binding protein [Geomicrobium halophilum]|uniref:ABC-type glycerol-3-phosphate transport system substrate-binding protein n=1 Tax=Geomicrobium halophilum TaxID=549000 RepID=A0A841PQ29_9BACL|nr:sugar ABC transporter substrate-binding protein [Geomicrobium halophilum]MBB6450937.1 ABC-type glycerol-3-phosphate transport system substrate-binding protein [Geomicrobium halophilum]
MSKMWSAKILNVLLPAVLIGCSPNGEGADQESEDEVVLDFMYWSSSDSEERAFQEQFQQFEEENPGIKIDAHPMPGDDIHMQAKIRIAADDAPDLIRIQYQQLGEYLGEDALLDVSDIYEDNIEQFNPSLLEAVSQGDAIYGMPHHTDTLALFYNKTYMDELGIEPPNQIDEAWTWEELFDVSQQLQEHDLANYGLAYSWDEGSAYRILPLFYQNSVSIFSNDLSEATVNTEDGVDTLRQIQEMYQNHMSVGNSARGGDDPNLLFTSGTAGMLIDGNWMIPEYEESTEFEWEVTFMPQGEQSASDMGGNAVAIPENAPQPEEGKKFLEFLGEADNNMAFAEEGIFIPGRTDVDDEIDYDFDDPDSIEAMEVFLEQAETVPEHMAQTMTIPEFNEINQVIADQMENLLVYEETPEDVANSLEEEIDSIIKD